MTDSPFRALPGVDTLLSSPTLSALALGPTLLAEAARVAIAAARQAIASGEAPPSAEAIAQHAARHATSLARPRLRRVLNATGVVVHTNLGRAPLAPDALQAAVGACNLEYDLAAGRRGSRRTHAEALLCALSGAEAALVVNNNAAALVLMLASLARAREVVISRGELVEIGGSFRIPDIMETSGARLREVGTTNRTHLADYARAITEDTACLLRVHPSNFRITGFTTQPSSAELAQLAAQHGLPLLHDLGSGTFGPLPPELSAEADLAAELAAGPDLLCFSGDKLLGGPQAGIILGRRDLVDRCAAHPLARALRADKLCLAALEHTLLAYRVGQAERVPVSRMLNAPLEGLQLRAESLARILSQAGLDAQPAPTEDAVGGGSHPGLTIPGRGVALRHPSLSADALARRLRAADLPVVGTVSDDRLTLHLRTVEPSDDAALADAVAATTPELDG